MFVSRAVRVYKLMMYLVISFIVIVSEDFPPAFLNVRFLFTRNFYSEKEEEKSPGLCLPPALSSPS